MNSNQTIALCMIVKNESKVIERALDSVKDFVNLYFICDTGSTDGTVEVLEKYFPPWTGPPSPCPAQPVVSPQKRR